MRKLGILLTAGVVSTVALLTTLGCQAEPEGPAPEPEEAVETQVPEPESQTEAPVSESRIPVQFTTYIDNMGTFSISYPTDWELALEQMGVTWEEEKKGLEKIGPDLAVEQATSVFLAGRPMGETQTWIPDVKKLDPYVNIIVEPNPGFTSWHELVEAVNVEAWRYNEYHLLDKVETTVGDKKALILEEKFMLRGLMSHGFRLFIIEERIIWSVTCDAGIQQFADEQENMNQIIRSFRTLK